MTRRKKKKKTSRNWRRVDLHIHTPASSCYEDPTVTYLDILQEAERKNLDIIALTDHNTVAGYATMMTEIEQLELLERLKRLRPDETKRLAEYRRLLDQILVLPGFEFTATFGFHILGIFDEDTQVRDLEHILLDLRIPPEKLDAGSSEVGATSDVLTAYRVIDEAGGLVIAAHVNSTHGVAMRGYDFGGQTKIAYTQDPHLHALEVTDLESGGRRSTASFYSGSKPEYSRRMHCIQGSDAHYLAKKSGDRSKTFGIGERATEIMLEEVSFAALKAVFLDNDFSRTRPYRPTRAPFDHIQAARQRGPSIIQSFHESMDRKGGRLHKVLCDVVAFANTSGGTIYVGVSANPRTPVRGVTNAQEAVTVLQQEIQRNITPPLAVSIDVQKSGGQDVVRVTVPKGPEPPYVLDAWRIYLRHESETSMAMRDEIVKLVQSTVPTPRARPAAPVKAPSEKAEPVDAASVSITPPKTGVEIVQSEERNGVLYHAMCDLRNNNVVHNVSRASSRRLWRYAITQREDQPVQEADVTWQGDVGFWKAYKRGGVQRYNLVQRDAAGNLRVYYGVTEEGIHGPWKDLVEKQTK